MNEAASSRTTQSIQNIQAVQTVLCVAWVQCRERACPACKLNTVGYVRTTVLYRIYRLKMMMMVMVMLMMMLMMVVVMVLVLVMVIPFTPELKKYILPTF